MLGALLRTHTPAVFGNIGHVLGVVKKVTGKFARPFGNTQPAATCGIECPVYVTRTTSLWLAYPDAIEQRHVEIATDPIRF